MKSLFLKIILAVGIIGISAIGYKPELLSEFSNLTSAAVSNFPGSMSDTIKNTSINFSLPEKEYETVYKWKDATGKLYYSNEPPKEGKQEELIKISRQQNIVRSKKMDSDLAKTKSSSTVGENGQLSGIMESYNKPIEKAVDAREKMEQHNRELEKIMQ